MPLLKPKFSQKQIEEIKTVIKNKESSKQEVCRAQTILMLNNDIDTAMIQALTGYCRKHTFRLRARYLETGLSAILDRRKGKPKSLLTKNQIKEISQSVKECSPQDFGYDNEEFWTTAILGDFIYRQYQVRYQSKTSYYLIFREAKFTFHKPGRIYQKHNDEEVRVWQENNELKIFKTLEDPNTVVLTEDEMILSTQTTFQKIWLPEDEYPKVEISNTKKNRSVYGFLNLKTGREHSFKTGWQNMYETVKILEKIRELYPRQKLLIIWDGAGWHRGKEVQKFIEKDQKIETIYFPRYAPELNPQEHVWKNGRSHCSHNRFIEDIDTSTDEFINYLNTNTFSYSLLGFSDIS